MRHIEAATDPALVSTLVEVEATSSSSIVDLAHLWSELCAGTTRIAATLCTDRRSYFKLVPTDSAGTLEPVSRRQRIILERLLLGESQKAVAMDLNRSAPMIAISARRCLAAWGLDCGSSTAPVLLLTALHAFHDKTELREGRSTLVERDSRRYRILSAPRPDACLISILSPSEREVASLRIDGKGLQEIAVLCSKSSRTVANQLGNVYRKLHVSCRIELVCRLLTGVSKR